MRKGGRERAESRLGTTYSRYHSGSYYFLSMRSNDSLLFGLKLKIPQKTRGKIKSYVQRLVVFRPGLA